MKYAGLTKTLVNLLRTRTPKSFVIGAYEINIENLINNDIAAWFDCDSVINKYISEAGEEASYERLSDVMKNTIWDRCAGVDGDLFVSVSSDTTSDGMYFNFLIFRSRTVTMPIILKASDSSFSTSFDTTGTVKFEADIDLFINTKLANTNHQSQATRVKINKLTFELLSGSDSEDQTDDSIMYVQRPEKTIPFYIDDKKYTAVARHFSIIANLYWHLAPKDANDFTNDEEQSFTLSYEQLEKGDFKWDNTYFGSFAADLIMIPQNEKWDSLDIANNSSEFYYTIDNLFDENGLEQISLCCNHLVKDGVTARNKKFTLR